MFIQKFSETCVFKSLFSDVCSLFQLGSRFFTRVFFFFCFLFFSIVLCSVIAKSRNVLFTLNLASLDFQVYCLVFMSPTFSCYVSEPFPDFVSRTQTAVPLGSVVCRRLVKFVNMDISQ